LEQRTVFRKEAAGTIQAGRYRDLAFRVFRNDALQKYDAQFKLAARYVYLAATAYDYELNLDTTSSASSFLEEIVRERNLGQVIDGQPSVGRVGLASIMGRMSQNFAVLRANSALTTTAMNRRGSRSARLRISRESAPIRCQLESPSKAVVTNLWNVLEFRRCTVRSLLRDGAQPGLSCVQQHHNGRTKFLWPGFGSSRLELRSFRVCHPYSIRCGLVQQL
jgi:hypothetical protein